LANVSRTLAMSSCAVITGAPMASIRSGAAPARLHTMSEIVIMTSSTTPTSRAEPEGAEPGAVEEPRPQPERRNASRRVEAFDGPTWSTTWRRAAIRPAALRRDGVRDRLLDEHGRAAFEEAGGARSGRASA